MAYRSFRGGSGRLDTRLDTPPSINGHHPVSRLAPAVDLATTAGVNERYLREWLSHQAASNYLSYDPSTRKFEMPPEQAMVFAIEDSPVYMVGAFDIMAALLDS